MPVGGVLAQSDPYEKDRDAGAMVADLVFTRPVGLAATVLGICVFVVSLPFSGPGGNTGQAGEKLVNEPARYTFQRPLGDM